VANRGVIFSGLGGSNQGQTYSVLDLSPVQPVPFVQPSYFNLWEVYATGVAPPQPAAPTASAAFSVDFTTSTSLPSQMSLSRASSATYFDSSGVLQTATSNVARFDYDPNSHEERGLLLEEQRTNTANKTVSSWTQTGSQGFFFDAAVTGIDGTSSGYPIRPAGPGAGTHLVFDSASVVATASPVTMSAYVKANGYNRICIRESATTGATAAFVLEKEGWVLSTTPLTTITSVVAGIQNVGNGWYRIWATMTPSSSISMSMGLTVVDSGYNNGNAFSYNWSSNNTGSVIISCPQLEIGAGATSYINNTTSTTRSGDIVSSTDATWLGYKGWVIETGELIADAAATLLGINTVTGLGYTSGSVLTTANGGSQSTVLTEYSPARNRGGIGWDSTPRVSIALDGSAVTTAANTPVTPTTLYFGNTNNGASGFLNGHIRQIGGYATLADADLPSVSVVGASFTGTGGAGNVGASAGDNTSVAVGAWLQAGTGSSAGTDTATAVGAWLQSGVGSSAGSNTASATGQAAFNGAGSSAGSNTATAVGAWLQSGVGSSAGTDTATATAAWLQSGVGSSAGTDTASGVGSDLQSGAGSAAGSNTATAVGHWLQSGVGNATGTNTATGFSAAVPNVGSSAGSNIATAVGAWVQAGVGSSVGSNLAAAISSWVQAGTGSSAGSNTAIGEGSFIGAEDHSFDTSFSRSDFSTYTTADFGGDFSRSDFSVYYVQHIVSGTGISVGGNIAAAVSTTEVFIPPVFPPVPEVVRLWHPATEYHRVQAPRATRIYRRGTELRRLAPQSMKRRYG
jgi:hypothetical protein